MRRARPRTVAAGRGLGGRDARRTRRPPNLSSLHDRCHVFLFRAPLTIHKHKNNSTADEARRPSRPEGCKLKLARRRSSPPRRDVTPDPVREHTTPIGGSESARKSVSLPTDTGRKCERPLEFAVRSMNQTAFRAQDRKQRRQTQQIRAEDGRSRTHARHRRNVGSESRDLAGVCKTRSQLVAGLRLSRTRMKQRHPQFRCGETQASCGPTLGDKHTNKTTE